MLCDRQGDSNALACWQNRQIVLLAIAESVSGYAHFGNEHIRCWVLGDGC